MANEKNIVKSKLPEYSKLIAATFKALKELGKPSEKRDIDNKVSEILDLGDEVIQSEHVFKDGRIMTKFEMYLGFCRSWLKKYGAIEDYNNKWEITASYKGIDSLTDDECRYIVNNMPSAKGNPYNLPTLTVDEVLNKFDIFIKSKSGQDFIKRENNELTPKHEKFLSDYPNGDAIRKMSLSDYCYGQNHSSFCSCLGTDLAYGSMGGLQRPCQLYNVIFDKKLSCFRAKVPNSHDTTTDQINVDDIFRQTKESIANLIESIPLINNRNYTSAINASMGLNKLFVGRILFVYDSENQTPVYSLDHLTKFLSVLNPSKTNASFLEKRFYLGKYFEDYIKPIYKEATQFIFMEFLYSDYGLHYVLENKNEASSKRKAKDDSNQLEDKPAQNPTSTITMREIEVEPIETLNDASSTKTSDGNDNAEEKPRTPRPYNGQDEGRKTETGRKGEDIVCSYLEEHREFLGDKIKGDINVFARTDDGIGYDICFDTENKGTIYIDVKSSINIQKGSVNFFMSANEYETMIKKHEAKSDSYYICFVDNVDHASEIRVIRSSLIIGRNVAVTYSLRLNESTSIENK